MGRTAGGSRAGAGGRSPRPRSGPPVGARGGGPERQAYGAPQQLGWRAYGGDATRLGLPEEGKKGAR